MITGHTLLASHCIHVLEIKKKKHKVGIYLTFLLLSQCFTLSIILIHRMYHPIIAGIFILSGLWNICFTYLMMTCIPVYFFRKKLGKLYPWLTSAMVSLCVGITIFGVVNTFLIKVRPYEIEIPDLPENWNGKKILHLTDVHLGVINRTGHAKRICRIIREEAPDLIVLTGDFLDYDKIDYSEMMEPFAQLAEDIPLYFITGNHEVYIKLDYVHQQIPESFHLIDDRALDLDGLMMVGVGYHDEFPLKEKYGRFQKPTILLNHEPRNLQDAASLDVDLMLCGHTHKGQIFPFGFLTNIVYRGYDYGLYDIHGMKLYVSNGVGSWGIRARTFQPPEMAIFTLVKKRLKNNYE